MRATPMALRAGNSCFSTSGGGTDSAGYTSHATTPIAPATPTPTSHPCALLRCLTGSVGGLSLGNPPPLTGPAGGSTTVRPGPTGGFGGGVGPGAGSGPNTSCTCRALFTRPVGS
ncbi:MAG TPA: hypothetical protein VEI97_12660, partial [bacterium]|nr:hypothetical protein [bacterium]